MDRSWSTLFPFSNRFIGNIFHSNNRKKSTEISQLFTIRLEAMGMPLSIYYTRLKRRYYNYLLKQQRSLKYQPISVRNNSCPKASSKNRVFSSWPYYRILSRSQAFMSLHKISNTKPIQVVNQTLWQKLQPQHQREMSQWRCTSQNLQNIFTLPSTTNPVQTKHPHTAQKSPLTSIWSTSLTLSKLRLFKTLGSINIYHTFTDSSWASGPTFTDRTISSLAKLDVWITTVVWDVIFERTAGVPFKSETKTSSAECSNQPQMRSSVQVVACRKLRTSVKFKSRQQSPIRTKIRCLHNKPGENIVIHSPSTNRLYTVVNSKW